MTEDGEFGSVGSRFSLGLGGFGVIESRDVPNFLAAVTIRDDTLREGDSFGSGEGWVICERFLLGFPFPNCVSNLKGFLLGEVPRDFELWARRS